jgi:hypothetical protein
VLRKHRAHIFEYELSDDGEGESVGILPDSPKGRAAAQGWSWSGAATDEGSLAPSQQDVYS